MMKTNRRKPSIRFRGFTDDWEQRKLGNITEEFKSGTFISAEEIKENGEYPVYGGNGLRGYSNTYNHDGEFALIGRQGALCGNVNYSTGKAYFTEHAVAVKANKTANIRFLYYLLDKMDLGQYSDQSAQPGLAVGKLIKLKNKFPSRQEQDKIGQYFERIDNLITLHQRKYDKLLNIKKSMLEKMFPKNDSKFPEIRFRGFTDAWEQRKLGDLSSSFEYGLNAAAKKYDGENKYIRITDIDDDSREFVRTDLSSPDTDLSNAENYRLSEGDILFARTGASVGKSYIYRISDGLVYYAGFLIKARIKNFFNPEFVFQNTLKTDYERFIKVTSIRSGQPGVNAQEYAQYEIMVPSRLEQDKVSTYMNKLDNLITLHQRKLEKLKNIKKSMLEKMFV